MHGGVTRNAHAQCRDLLVLGDAVAQDPHAATALNALTLNAQTSQDVNDDFLDDAHIRHHVNGLGQAQNRVAGQLAGAVPGQLAAAVNLDDGGGLVCGVLVVFGAFTGSNHCLVLKQKNRILAGAVSHLIVDAVLLVQALNIVHIVRGEAHAFNRHRHTFYLSTAGGGKKIRAP